MSKHRLSPAPLPPAKRIHTISSQSYNSNVPHATFDTLYDELILVIFFHLSPSDLCRMQTTNKNWSRLAGDNQLWKALYLKEYGKSRLRGVRGFVGRMDGREVKPLPGRAKADDTRDWKWMFRISSNWRNGRCSVDHLEEAPQESLDDLLTSEEAQLFPAQTHILLAGTLTITASSRASPSPRISLSGPSLQTYHLSCPSRSPGYRPVQITALTLDQSPPTSSQNLRIAAFLSSGEFTIWNVDYITPSSSSRGLTYLPRSMSLRLAPIIRAVFHYPLLVTLSETFHLSIYNLSDDAVVHTQTLTSFTSYPPTSMVLSVPSPTTYKLVLAYAVPVYPAHWSLGATELIISSAPESMTVVATRTISAFDIPAGWVDSHKLRLVREQWGRKVERIADTQTDGKWVVLAPGYSTPFSVAASLTSSKVSDSHTPTSLQLYRLSFPSSASSSMPLAKLTFVRTLHGHLGPVTALALADGRCVSLGENGSIWVWDLEAGTGAEVAQACGERMVDGNGTVAFDERKIISARAGAGVQVRRFDI